MAKKKPSREYFDGENNSGHYNFVIIDREILFSPDENKKNVRSSLGLSLAAIGLYAVIKAHAIDKNFCFPSLLTLQKLTGVCKDTLIKYIRELSDAELIVVEKMNNEGGGRDKNVYVIPQVDKERLRMDALMSIDSQCRQNRPCSDNDSSMSIKSTLLVENVDLAKSEKSTVSILNNNTNQLRQSATRGKILFTWEEWEFMETGMVRNNETGKEYPVRWRGFAFPIDIVMMIDEHYPLYKK